MKRHLNFLTIILLLAGTLALCSFRFHGFTTDLANLLIESATDSQRKKLWADFDSQKRFDWSYLPPYSVPRGGLPLKEMDDDQKELVGQLLSFSLSEAGYEKVKLIMSLEDILAEIESNPQRDRELYYVSIFGDPSGNAPWAWQFDGHHLSLHFTIVSGEVSYTPRFLGANPAEVKQGPKKGLRVLNKEEDLAFALLNSLSKAQTSKAIFKNSTFGDRDIVTKNSVEVSALEPVGVSFSELAGDQQKLLWAIIDEYLSAMPSKAATTRRNEIAREGEANIRFGWAGSVVPGAPHYYRVQGSTFLIEFDNTQGGGNHIHSVWRDFEGDFGRDLIREHYARTKH